MAETIKTGYLINKVPYKVFDEIISFIDKTGTIYNCMSLGSKRITSKNGRQLFYATPIEFEIFQSRFDNKLSKLKKAHALEEIDWKIETNKALILLNEIIIKSKITTKEFFTFYKNMLKIIKENKYSVDVIRLIIMWRFLELNAAQVDFEQYESNNVLNNLQLLESGKYNKIESDIPQTFKFLKNYIKIIL
ncbi:MAG: hypothetical protein LBQ45_02715 [Mycoplasmataceae bacterium]|nr:hypothetical protein [Mycoplasmataceae bacterium]